MVVLTIRVWFRWNNAAAREGSISRWSLLLIWGTMAVLTAVDLIDLLLLRPDDVGITPHQNANLLYFVRFVTALMGLGFDFLQEHGAVQDVACTVLVIGPLVLLAGDRSLRSDGPRLAVAATTLAMLVTMVVLTAGREGGGLGVAKQARHYLIFSLLVPLTVANWTAVKLRWHMGPLLAGVTLLLSWAGISPHWNNNGYEYMRQVYTVPQTECLSKWFKAHDPNSRRAIQQDLLHLERLNILPRDEDKIEQDLQIAKRLNLVFYKRLKETL